MVIFARGQAELHENAANVLLHGPFGDPETVRDAGIRSAFGHECEDLPLPGGELGERVGLPALPKRFSTFADVKRCFELCTSVSHRSIRIAQSVIVHALVTII